MPLILPSAALLVVLTRPGPAETSTRQNAPQAEPAEKTKKKKKDKDKDAKKAKPEYPYFRLDGDHPSIHFGKGTHLDFRARFAADAKDSDAPSDEPEETSDVDLEKARIGISGEIKNAVEFQVEAELTGDDTWRDVYADFKKFTTVRVRGGKFKIPFSLDENTGAAKLDFMFRSLAATHLAPGRDEGVMVHGKLFGKLLGYEAGVFQHDGKNARTNNITKVYGGQTTAARVTVEPLAHAKNAIGDLSIGAAFTQSDVPEGISGLRGQTVLEQNFFSSSNYIVNGPRKRVGIEFMFRPGPASIKSEWMRVETQRRGESVEDTDLSPIVGEGWYVSGTFAVTGEKKTSVDRPKKPLFPGLGYGAIELAARVENLKFSSGSSSEAGSKSPRADTVLGNADQATTFGVNWYVNRWFKIQANIIREKIDDPSLGPLPSKSSFMSKAIRFQFSL
jgi:phosphate-selective porin OprO and OprP